VLPLGPAHLQTPLAGARSPRPREELSTASQGRSRRACLAAECLLASLLLRLAVPPASCMAIPLENQAMSL
jgi:hypothetical protein